MGITEKIAMADGDFLGLTGQTALVTGGAKGIGFAVARRLAQLGAGVLVIDRGGDSQGAIKRLRVELPQATPLQCLRADVTDRAAMEAIRDRLKREGQTLDIVIPNAGINVRLPTLEVSPAQVDSIIATNLTGVIATLQIFVPLIIGRPQPRVVVTSSLSAVHGMSLRGTYAATKAGVSGLVRALAVEWGPLGVNVNAVGPGIIHTALVDGYMKQHPDRVEATIRNTPLRRIGTPADVADAVVFLASHAARFVTGQTLLVDGGISAGSDWW
jgi:NAD(P)-dependent dehydrogenase (short-subunit alcohol dehydrogenase family)